MPTIQTVVTLQGGTFREGLPVKGAPREGGFPIRGVFLVSTLPPCSSIKTRGVCFQLASLVRAPAWGMSRRFSGNEAVLGPIRHEKKKWTRLIF